jgi:hypothetical protein
MYVPGDKLLMADEVAGGLFQEYVYGKVPPDTVAAIAPIGAPLQGTFVTFFCTLSAAGCVIITVSFFWQLLASLVVEIYIPGVRLVTVGDVAERLFHVKV